MDEINLRLEEIRAHDRASAERERVSSAEEALRLEEVRSLKAAFLKVMSERDYPGAIAEEVMPGTEQWLLEVRASSASEKRELRRIAERTLGMSFSVRAFDSWLSELQVTSLGISSGPSYVPAPNAERLYREWAKTTTHPVVHLWRFQVRSPLGSEQWPDNVSMDISGAITPEGDTYFAQSDHRLNEFKNFIAETLNKHQVPWPY